MDSDKVKAMRKAVNDCSIEQAARMTRVSPRSWQAYERGERKIPESVVELFLIKSGLSLDPWVEWEVEWITPHQELKYLKGKRDEISEELSELNRKINRLTIKASKI